MAHHCFGRICLNEYQRFECWLREEACFGLSSMNFDAHVVDCRCCCCWSKSELQKWHVVSPVRDSWETIWSHAFSIAWIPLVRDSALHWKHVVWPLSRRATASQLSGQEPGFLRPSLLCCLLSSLLSLLTSGVSLTPLVNLSYRPTFCLCLVV